MTRRRSDVDFDFTEPQAKRQRVSNSQDDTTDFIDFINNLSPGYLKDVLEDDPFAEDNITDVIHVPPPLIPRTTLSIPSRDNLPAVNDKEIVDEETLQDFIVACDKEKSRRDRHYIKSEQYKVNKLNVVIAPMGSGKTTALKKFLEDENLWCKKVLTITCRISLANVAGAYYEEGTSYKEIGSNVIDSNIHPHVHICINSLRRIQDVTEYDVIVLDEFKSTLSMLMSKICFNSAKYLADLKRLVEWRDSDGNGKTIFCMDAIMTQRELNWIKNCTESDPNFVNFVKHSLPINMLPFNSVYFEKNLGLMIRYIIMDVVARRKKIAITTNCKDFWEKVMGLLRCGSVTFKSRIGLSANVNTTNIKTIMFSSDNAEEFESFLKNPYQKQDEVPDILITTPVLGPGTSLSTFEVNYVVGHFAVLNGNPAEHVQMLGRYRLNKEKRCLVYLEEFTVEIPTLDDFFKQETFSLKEVMKDNFGGKSYFHQLLHTMLGKADDTAEIYKSLRADTSKRNEDSLIRYFKSILNELPKVELCLLTDTWEEKREALANYKENIKKMLKYNCPNIKIGNLVFNNKIKVCRTVLNNMIKNTEILHGFKENIYGKEIKVVCPSVAKCIKYNLFGLPGSIIDSCELKIEEEFSKEIVDIPCENILEKFMDISSCFPIRKVLKDVIRQDKKDWCKYAHSYFDVIRLYRELFIILGLNTKDSVQMIPIENIEFDPWMWVLEHYSLMSLYLTHLSTVRALTNLQVKFLSPEQMKVKDITTIRKTTIKLFSAIGLQLQPKKRVKKTNVLESMQIKPAALTIINKMKEKIPEFNDFQYEDGPSSSKRPSLYYMQVSEVNIQKVYDLCFRKLFVTLWNSKNLLSTDQEEAFSFNEHLAVVHDFCSIPYPWIMKDADFDVYNEKLHNVLKVLTTFATHNTEKDK